MTLRVAKFLDRSLERLEKFSRLIPSVMVLFSSVVSSTYSNFYKQCELNHQNYYEQLEKLGLSKRHRHHHNGAKIDNTLIGGDDDDDYASKHDAVLDFMRKSPLEKLDSIIRFAQAHHYLLLSVYIVDGLKNIVIIILGIDYFSDYHLLDCFILGRFRYIGRTSKIGSWLLLIVANNFILSRAYMYYFAKDNRFYFFEFLLYDRVYVERMDKQERQFDVKRKSLIGRIRHRSNSNEFQTINMNDSLKSYQIHNKTNDSSLQGYSMTSSASVNQEQTNLDSFFFVRNQYTDHNHSPEWNWFLRPNRSLKCWRKLSRINLFAFLMAINQFMLTVLFMIFVIGGQIVSHLGYQLSYSHCAGYLNNVQARQISEWAGQIKNTSDLDYNWIYVPSQSNIFGLVNGTRTNILADQIEMDNLPFVIPWVFSSQWTSAYGFMRVLFDFLNNFLWYNDFTTFLISQSYIVFGSSTDIIMNVIEIREQLKSIIQRLRERHLRDSFQSSMFRSTHRDRKTSNIIDSSHFVLPPRTDISDSVEHELVGQQNDQMIILDMIRVQTLLVDHFEKIRGYSLYISFYIVLIVSLFFQQFFGISYWMTTIKSRAVEREFILTETVSCALATVLLSGMAITRSYNYKLYSLVTSAMALDEFTANTKTRWMLILKFFYPEPMYCFNFLRSTEISWLFILNIAVWVISVYLVLASFWFNHYRKTM